MSCIAEIQLPTGEGTALFQLLIECGYSREEALVDELNIREFMLHRSEEELVGKLDFFLERGKMREFTNDLRDKLFLHLSKHSSVPIAKQDAGDLRQIFLGQSDQEIIAQIKHMNPDELMVFILRHKEEKTGVVTRLLEKLAGIGEES